MFAANLTRPVFSLLGIFHLRATKTAPQRGTPPTWINDAQLSRQLLKDTGLTPETFGSRPAFDDKKPFFMQQSFW